ncbi:hypothetical protein PBY51_014556 [Eleginops maclovinus]|uniref:SH3 domain-containing protein n=1 Tax=Eleginops maclovinus TaxID=56733 RepID=A0AAN7WVL1_ELEMC|nr:hypothetical protein PBY51_014556 [Eleginops maclovinus]
MQRIYTHSNAHFEVFTTVLQPQGRQRCRAEAEKMVVLHSYSPQWPDELQLRMGEVVLVLPRPEEQRWFGRLQDGRQGFLPSSCVVELSQVRALQRSFSVRSNDSGVSRQSGHIAGAPVGGSSGGLDGGQGESRGPQRSPSLLHRILSKVRRRSQCQGATNGAFQGD